MFSGKAKYVFISLTTLVLLTAVVDAGSLATKGQPAALASSCTGTVSLDRSSYGCDDMVTITLEDSDLAGQGTATVSASSSGDARTERVTLSETAGSAGIFTGTVHIVERPWAIPGATLGVGDGELLTVSYLDADACGTPNQVITATAGIDCEGCVASRILVDRSTYSCDDIVTITLEGSDLAGTGTAVVSAASSGDQQVESVMLTELPASSGVFVGSVSVVERPWAVPGMTLGVADGETLTLSYLDADACGTPNQAVTATAEIDCGSCAVSRLLVDRSTYSCGDEVMITLEDGDLAGTGAALVSVASSGDTHVETVALSELPGAAGVFRGFMPIVERPWAIPGVSLGVGDGETLTVSYLDVDACGVPNQTVTTTAAIACGSCTPSQLSVDKEEYSCSDTVSITLEDSDLAGQGTVVVAVSSSGDTSTEAVTLHELPGAEGTFVGALPVVQRRWSIPGYSLGVTNGATITVSYRDTDACGQGSAVVTAAAGVVCAAESPRRVGPRRH